MAQSRLDAWIDAQALHQAEQDEELIAEQAESAWSEYELIDRLWAEYEACPEPSLLRRIEELVD